MNRRTSTSSLFSIWTKTYAFVMLCYSPFLFYFLWGNHDWSWIKEYTPIWSGLFEGRFSQFFLPTLLFSGQILPILSISVGLATLTFAPILLLRLWNFSAKSYLIFLLAFITTISPYTLSWFYFAFLTVSCLTWPLIIIFAFYSLQKNKSSVSVVIIATILFTLSLGGYPPIINMIGIILITLILNDLCLNNLPLAKILRKYTPHIISIILSVLLFYIIQYFLKHFHLQFDTYNTAGINLSLLPQKIKIALSESLTQFTYTTSFINTTYKYLTLFLCLSGLIYLWKALPKNTINITIFIFLILCLLVSSVFTTIIAQNTPYVLQEPRIKFFTLPNITLFSASVLLLSRQKLLRNIVFTILIILALNNTVTNCYAAKVWSFGFKAEANFSERILSRLEEQENFNPTQKQYTFIQSGTINFRHKYYIKEKNTPQDSYTLIAPYIPWHLPYKAYTFYYPQIFVKQDFDVYWQTINPKIIDMNTQLASYLSQDAEPWPHKNALYFSSDLIILTLSNQGIQNARNWFYQNF